MNPTTLKALRKSISHWEQVVADINTPTGVKHCALCREFYSINCDGCPVLAATLKRHCEGSPYDEWVAAETKEERVDAATAELTFLRSLLPDKELKMTDHHTQLHVYLLTAIDEIRAKFSAANIPDFKLEITASGRSDTQQVLIEYQLGERYQYDTPKGSTLSAVIEETLRRKGWNDRNNPMKAITYDPVPF